MFVFKNFCLNLFFLFTLLFMVSCQGSIREQKADVVSSATPIKGSSLPLSNSDYTVIGHVNGIQNYVVKYDDSFYRGGMARTEVGVSNLAKHGIKTILTIVHSDELSEWAAKYGIEVIEVPFESKTGVSEEILAKYLTAIQSDKGPFYTSCFGGSHRAGTLSLAYRVYVEKWSFEKALSEFKALGGDPKGDWKMLTTVKPHKN